MAPTTFWSQDVSSGYAVGFPGVAHIVADLDDLDALAIATPITAGRHRKRRASVLRRISSALSRRLMRRRVASLTAMTTVVMAVAACSDTNDPRPVPIVAVVRVSPLAIVLPEGGLLQLRAFAYDSTGAELFGRAIRWETDAAETVAVSAAGQIRAVRSGYATITAKIDDTRSSTAVTVTDER